ncbi:hypothetical protein FW774_05875 [Pedobacter sp. BS3]|uniref:hypothetical protein n=1 Tax=Pedobacter sp. BS3 TaxID=2567937 RepID=UPI0011EFF17F|nr:hypothetical protein [Pedobacter sp. BS3]TZF84515.1 hypothetical protein FW774_05875 [Pedobacter sp. BS3]
MKGDLDMLCGKINQNMTVDCDNPLVAGVKDRMVVIAFEDWQKATITRDVSNPLLITNIALAADTTGYVYEGINGSHEPEDNSTQPEMGLPVYIHKVTFRVFSASAAAKQQVEKLVRGRVVIITENNMKGADGEQAFEVRGAEVGMKSTVTRARKDAATQGAFVLTTQTLETEGEPHLPATLFAETYSATKTIFDSLYETEPDDDGEGGDEGGGGGA